MLRLPAVGVEHLGEGGTAAAAGVLDEFSVFRHAHALTESHVHMFSHEELLSLTPVVASSWGLATSAGNVAAHTVHSRDIGARGAVGTRAAAGEVVAALPPVDRQAVPLRRPAQASRAAGTTQVPASHAARAEQVDQDDSVDG